MKAYLKKMIEPTTSIITVIVLVKRIKQESGISLENFALKHLENQKYNLLHYSEYLKGWSSFNKKYSIYDPNNPRITEHLFVPYLDRDTFDEDIPFPTVTHLYSNAIFMYPYSLIRIFPNLQFIQTRWLDYSTPYYFERFLELEKISLWKESHKNFVLFEPHTSYKESREKFLHQGVLYHEEEVPTWATKNHTLCFDTSLLSRRLK